MKHGFTFFILLVWSAAAIAQSETTTRSLTRSLPPLGKLAIQQPPAAGAARKSSALATTIRYVKANAGGTGASWSDAGDIQAMINASASGDQVWIAGGTYKPSTTGLTDARTATFSLKNGVSVLGGFTGVAGTEGNINARTAIPSSTTLSGDIGNVGDASDNTLHVVTSNNSTILDGVAITGGNANGSDNNSFGGGIISTFGSPSITNCQFSQNYASNGGAIDNAGTNGAKIINCSFQSNSANFAGGINDEQTSNTAIINCFFSQNTEGFRAALSTNVTLTNCTFSGNTRSFSASAIVSQASSVNLINSLLWNNGGQDAIRLISEGTVTISYSLLESGATNYTNGGNNQTLTSSPFANATGPQLLPCSPAVDAGNDEANSTNTDVLGNARKVRTIDIGAAEFQDSPTQPVTITSQSQSATTVCGTGQFGSFRVDYTGTGLFTVAFFIDNTPLLEVITSSHSMTFNTPSLQSGSYQIVITSACNSVTTTFAPITVNPLPTAYNVTGGGAYCAGGTGVAVGLSGSQTGVNYQLRRDGNAVGSPVAGTGNTLTFGDQSQVGNYTVKATSTAGSCQQTMTGSATVSIIQLPNATLSNNGPITCSSPTVSLSASGGGTYSFSPGASQVSGGNTAIVNQEGVYSVTVTSSGCSVTATTTVTSNTVAPQNVTLSSSSTLTCATTSVNLTAGSATPGVSYSFTGSGLTSSNGATATVNQEGLYTVKVTGTNGCSATQNTTVNSNTLAPTATLGNSGTITCANRTVTLTAGGGNAYAFSSGASQVNGGNTATVTSGGVYSVTVTGINGCTATNTTSVESNTTAPAATLSNSGPIADNNQTLTLTASGGGTYAFSSGATQQGGGNTATTTTAGPYSVTVTGTNGCTAVASTTVTGTQNPATVCRGGTVIIKVVASGNPVKYEWYKNTLSSVRLTEVPNQQRGTATASLTLTNQQTNANFYVRVTDANGSAIVYGPIKLTVNMGCITPLGRLAAEEIELKITLLGNPISGEQLRASVSGAAGKALSVQLLELNGKSIRQQVWPQAESEQSLEWNMGGQASGVYLLQAITGDGNQPAQRTSVKVIKH